MFVLFVLGPAGWWLTAKRLRLTTAETWSVAVLALIAMLLLPFLFSALLWWAGIRSTGWTGITAIAAAFELAVALMVYQEYREPQWYWYNEQTGAIERRRR